MGMSIDEAIKVIHKMLAYTDLNVRANLNADMIGACHMAIETMRKYQKIQEIIADWRSDGGAFEMSEPYWLRLISEVIEDGNVD